MEPNQWDSRGGQMGLEKHTKKNPTSGPQVLETGLNLSCLSCSFDAFRETEDGNMVT